LATIHGTKGRGNDTLIGTKRKDTIDGRAGNDTITGGKGSDVMTGGKGNDVFVYNSIDDSPVKKFDTITDFKQGADKIDLRPLLGATDLKFGGTTPAPNGVWFQRMGGKTFVFADVTGDNTPDLKIQLNGTFTLTSADFLGVGGGDTVAPTVAIVVADAALSIGGTSLVTFTFSEIPTAFTNADVTIANGMLSVIAATVDPLVFTATLTPDAAVTDATNVITVGTAWQDPAGNAPAATSISNNYAIDTVAPTVTITSTDSALQSGDVATLTFTLSEASTDFGAVDIVVTGGMLSNFAGSGTSYTAAFTPTPNSTTGATVDVAGGTFNDAAGNDNTVATQLTMTIDTVTVDTVAPTVALVNTVTSTPENGAAVKVADIVVTDNALGTNVLSLSGTNAASFSIVGTELRFNGSADFETLASYNVTVEVDDATVGGSPDDSASLTLTVLDQNDVAPTITTAAAQSVNENEAVSVALTATDGDTVGTNPATFAITGGADSSLFSIVGGNLMMTAQNFEAPADADANNTYVVDVTAHDGANTTPKTITVTVLDQNDAPVFSLVSDVQVDSDTVALTKGTAPLGGFGSLTVADADLSDELTLTVVSVVASGTTTDLGSDEAALLAMLMVFPAGSFAVDPGSTHQISWGFNSKSESFSYLAADEVLTLTYTVRATDDSAVQAFDDQLVTITIKGSNVAPEARNDIILTNIPQTNEILIPATALLANDTDHDNDPLNINVASAAAMDDTVTSPGAVVYTDNSTQDGSFEYKAFDGTASSEFATVTVDTQVGATVTGTVANEILIGSDGDDTLNGNGGNDIFIGGLGQDTVNGGSGDDRITMLVKAGNVDTIDAGGGTDTLFLSGVVPGNHMVVVDLGAADQVVSIGGEADTLKQKNFENIDVSGLGSSANVTGNAGDNIIIGSHGDDTLLGGAGDDTYVVNPGDGQDTISESAGNSDRLLYGATINPLDLVISRQANDLRIAVYGSTDQVTIQNWFGGTDNQVETIQAGNGQTLLSTQVDGLIQAMAQFSASNNGLTWDQDIAQKPQEVQEVLAASWH